jgi:DNA-binding beta-propeller fold protein YncE
VARSFRSPHVLVAVAAALLTVVAACSAPSPPAVDPSTPSAAPSTGTVALYTLEKGEHRSPVPIVWDAESQTFFVATVFDGTIYRGRIDEPSVQVFLEGQPGRGAGGIGISGGRLLLADGMYGNVLIYDLQTRQRIGEFATGSGGSLHGLQVTEAGDVWVTDAVRPVLWHLTPDQVAAGSGTPAALPLGPEIPYVCCPDNVQGVVALSETRLVVVKFADGTLYRIDLDPQAPQGRTITPITGATVPLGSRMILDGKRLVVADENGLSVVELSDDASSGTVVTRLRDPSFRDTTAVARVGDRYLVVNAAWNLPPPYTISSVPVVP